MVLGRMRSPGEGAASTIVEAMNAQAAPTTDRNTILRIMSIVWSCIAGGSFFQSRMTDSIVHAPSSGDVSTAIETVADRIPSTHAIVFRFMKSPPREGDLIEPPSW